MKKCKRIITIAIGILLLLILIVLMYFKGDFTYDDMNDILAKTVSIDICQNKDFDNDKLLSCDDKDNELIISIGKNSEHYELISNMYTNAREKNIITDSLETKLDYKINHYYKAIFKDDNGN